VGRYTHRVAISNNRLLDIEDGQVQFRYKDYRQDNQQKVMPLSADEFIRRFLLHVLPDGFHRIRYYGFLGNRYRQQKLACCRRFLGMASADQTTPATDRCFTPAMPGLPPRLHDSYRPSHRRLYIPNLEGHFMRTVRSQRVPLQACLRQVRGEVSPDPPPSTSSSFHSGSAPSKSLVIAHPTLRLNSFSHQNIAFSRASLSFNTRSASGIGAV
jgi:hypothetical protein